MIYSIDERGTEVAEPPCSHLPLAFAESTESIKGVGGCFRKLVRAIARGRPRDQSVSRSAAARTNRFKVEM